MMGTKEFMAFSQAQLAMKASDMEYEITTLREKLRVAEDCLSEYESREIDSGNLRGGIAAVALREIREIG